METLSDKIIRGKFWNDNKIRVNHVKEFIKNVKNIDFEGFYPEHIIEVIDELAGKELSNG